jgi:DNA-binding response OmpR family regulator
MHRQRKTMAVKQDVLIVDDDVAIVDFIMEALTDEGYSVRAAHDGCSALAEIATFPPALVLLDLHLQGMPGTELLELLRSKGCSTLPVVLMTADLTAAKELAAESNDKLGLLFKPFNLDDLFSLVAHYVLPHGTPPE